MITFSKATSGEVYLVYKPDFADSTWFQNELREQKKGYAFYRLSF